MSKERCPNCGNEFDNLFEQNLQANKGDKEKAYAITRKICLPCERAYKSFPVRHTWQGFSKPGGVNLHNEKWFNNPEAFTKKGQI